VTRPRRIRLRRRRCCLGFCRRLLARRRAPPALAATAPTQSTPRPATTAATRTHDHRQVKSAPGQEAVEQSSQLALPSYRRSRRLRTDSVSRRMISRRATPTTRISLQNYPWRRRRPMRRSRRLERSHDPTVEMQLIGGLLRTQSPASRSVFAWPIVVPDQSSIDAGTHHLRCSNVKFTRQPAREARRRGRIPAAFRSKPSQRTPKSAHSPRGTCTISAPVRRRRERMQYSRVAAWPRQIRMNRNAD